MKMARIDNPLVGFLNFGQFDLFNPRVSSKRQVINRLIKLIVFFNAFKIIVIVLAAWLGFLDLKLYLIELYLFDESNQKVFDLGYSVLHLGLCYGFAYWSSLNKKQSSLKSFRFLLILDAKDPCQFGKRYQLDKQSTERFLVAYRHACLLMRLFVAAYSAFALATISRCLYHSFYHVSLIYFLSVSLLLGVITLIGYVLMILFLIPKLILMLISTEFLVLRVKGLDAQICNQFLRTKLTSISSPIKLRKQKKSTLKALHLLNDFCRQFYEINSVQDSTISVCFLGGFMIIFTIPYFLTFVENTLSIRLFLSAMIVISYLVFFSFFLYNDRLARQVGLLYTKSIDFENNQSNHEILMETNVQICFSSLDQSVGEHHTLHPATF